MLGSPGNHPHRDRRPVAVMTVLGGLLALLVLLPGAASGARPAPSGGPGGAAGDSADPADPTGRYIVVLRDDALAGDPTRAVRRVVERAGVRAERTFERALRGFAARLDPATRKRLAADPAVAAVVPDERIEITGFVPTGVRRVKAPASSVADIDGLDDARVDADIAIVDTGIDPSHTDLNVVGGYNCSSSDPTAWFDENGHGTHVAGTAAAIDRSSGLTGVAPGARLWAVRILDANGAGLLSWFVCGLDWITAQRDPADPSRPLFEAVNMSVTKWGRDDGNCGFTNNDLLHQAICRLVASGVTVVAAAANDASSAAARVPAAYDEVITVSALADTDGLPGGKGGPLCWSWGGYDVDDTFADFSNYGSDVDLIAPGKCIWSSLPGGRRGYSSGTSMAAPHVTGAVALYKASRPEATPAEVREALRYLGSFDWDTSTDPDGVPDPLLDVSRIGPLGTFSLRPETATIDAPLQLTEAGGSIQVPIAIDRSATFFEPVGLTVVDAPAGFGASISPSRAFGFEATRATLSLSVPRDTPGGRYEVRIRGTYHSLAEETTVALEIAVPGFTRLAGADRYATAAAISAATFGPGVKVAYVATGLNFPDALAAAAAAGMRGGPVLLVTRDAIPAPTAAELARLRPERIVVVGSSGVVGTGVAAALKPYATSGVVERLAGADRYGTAAAISAATFGPGVKVAYVATGLNFPDALAAAAAAGMRGGPVLLVTRDAIPAPTAAELARLRPERIVVVGSSGVVGTGVAAALKPYATSGVVERLAGADRYGTAAAISAATFGPGVKVAYVATGLNFPDALAAAAAAGMRGGPVLLVTRDAIPAPTAAELARLRPERIVVVGSSGVVGTGVAAALAGYLASP